MKRPKIRRDRDRQGQNLMHRKFNDGGDQIPLFMASDNLKTFIDKVLKVETISYQVQGGTAKTRVVITFN